MTTLLLIILALATLTVNFWIKPALFVIQFLVGLAAALATIALGLPLIVLAAAHDIVCWPFRVLLRRRQRANALKELFAGYRNSNGR